MADAMIDREMKPLQQENVITQGLDGELALCSTDSGEIHFLNTAAKLVWDLCDGNHTIEDMERVMRATFAIDAGQDILADIKNALEELRNKNLVTGI